ncbi:DUF4406 domain-containing protein [Alicyclobacillus tolerans]|uniref:DUF4406 domain-containing protein n=1 Tax=Alicyclobacillus tolerans TaxID=90970 RepID=UPI001F173F8F|nr:DUF4406 domain-containing protein [Alicyclobacillus tolerans]MCF8566890.1 DUF4406 domain-containing protein [Alicyclobacillus tolerans]
MTKQRVYISGPMTGYEDYNRPAFHAMASQLKDAGYRVYNPADVVLETDDWAQYMKIHLAVLPTCDLVVVLPGWQKSRGARLEVANAHFLGIPVKHWPEMIDLVEKVEPRFARTYDGLWI